MTSLQIGRIDRAKSEKSFFRDLMDLDKNPSVSLGEPGKLPEGYVRRLRLCFSRKLGCTVRVNFLINVL